MVGSLIVVADAILTPLTQFTPPSADRPGQFDGGVYYGDGTLCQLGRSRMINHDNHPGPAPACGPPTLPGTHLWCGLVNNAHFGHFISESLARLWALDSIRPPDSLVFFCRLPAQPLPGWAMALFDALAPGIALTRVRAPLRADRVVVPESASLPSGVMRGDALNRAFLHRRLIPAADRISALWGAGRRRLYVSRAQLATEAQILHEDQIEAQMADQGYRVIHPETLPLDQQLALYHGADDLVFAEGSALHLYALVCRPDQRLFVIWRRRTAYAGFANQINSFGGPQVQGRIHTTQVLVPAEAPGALARAHGLLDLASLSADLRDAGFIAGPDWPQPDAEATRALMAARYPGFRIT